MSITLGSAFAPRLPPPPPTEQETLLAQVLDAMSALREAVLTLPAPQVHVQPQDLSDIVNAVQALNGPAGPSASDIAVAIRDTLLPVIPPPAPALPVAELIDALQNLDFRLKGVGGKSGVGGTVATIAEISSPVRTQPEPGFIWPVSGTVTATGGLTDTQLRATPVPVSGTVSVAGSATEATLQKVQRAITDQETRMDFDVRTDSNPVYIGKNLQGTATSASTWTIQKFTYDSSNRPTRIEVLTGVWDNRASLSW